MRTIIISVVLVLTSIAGIAQKKGSPTKPANDLDVKYTPPQSSIFNSKSEENSGKIGTVKTVLDFNITLLARGVMGFGGERQIGKSPLSLNAGLGFVYSKDFTQQLVASPDGFELFSSAVNTQFNFGDILKYSTFSPKNRMYASLGLRFYPNYSGDLDGPYFEVGARWHKYETKLTSVNNSSGYDYVIPQSIYTQVKSATYAVYYGYQSYGGNGRFYNNIYWGLGFKKVEFGGVSETDKERFNSNGYTESYKELRSNGLTAVGIAPTLLFGWEIGFGL
jgi:hypothetical protein